MDIKIWRNKPRTTKSVSLVKLKTQGVFDLQKLLVPRKFGFKPQSPHFFEQQRWGVSQNNRHFYLENY